MARQGRINTAARHFTKAIELRPRFAEARFNLAQVHLQTGAVSDAMKQFEVALLINPQFTAARTAREKITPPTYIAQQR
jgi:tetratricopeptide (TPR) repeat protein